MSIASLGNASACQHMIDYVTDEIRRREENGDTVGIISLSPVSTRPEILHFGFNNTAGGKILHLDITKGTNVVEASSHAHYDDTKEVESAVASVLGFGEIFASGITAEKAVQIQKILADNGVDPDETATVAQAIGYVLGEEWESVLDRNR